MIFITNHVKMGSNRRCTTDIQTEDEGESFIEQVTRVVQTHHLKKQSMVDVVVAMVAVPLLVVFSLMLQNNMRSDWLHDVDTRWRILGLGLSLLFVSLVVCLYVTHRLGLCIWAAQQNQEATRRSPDRRRISHRGPPPLTSNGSQLHLMVSGELPPSYDSVMRSRELPPPYFSVFIFDEKNGKLPGMTDGPPNVETRSQEIPGVHLQVPTG